MVGIDDHMANVDLDTGNQGRPAIFLYLIQDTHMADFRVTFERSLGRSLPEYNLETSAMTKRAKCAE
jgi:hypothetical protein